MTMHGADIGKSCRIYPSVRIWAPWNVIAEPDSVIGPRCNVYSMATIRLGEKAVVSQDVELITGSHDYTAAESQPWLPITLRPITIGKNCWICAKSFILPGIAIKDGAVIGACSVVTHDQPAWMVCVGNPCRPIKKRLVTDPAST